MTDNYILFQNAPKRGDCDGCQEIIPAGHLEVVYQKFYHFDCFFNVFDLDVCDKKIISIATEKYMDENKEPKPFVSLEDFDFIGGFNLRISEADLIKIREHLALAKEHKTRYFIPSVLRTNDIDCAGECYFRSRRGSGVGKELGLLFQNNEYNPEYQKDNTSYLLPTAETTSFEKNFCAEKIKYKIIGLRIRYQTKTYHPESFAEMGKVNMDGEEIGNYHKLSYCQKRRLRNLFKKSNDFDIPLIEEAKRDDYCTLADCPDANGRPSKFPWPYTIKRGDLHIKFHGDIYHPSCFKSTKKSEMDIKDFFGYESLSQRTKHLLEKIFEDTEMDIEEDEPSGDGGGSSGFKSDQMDDDNDVEGPPAKKSKMEPQMQDENVSNENIENEFDNDQEPFDGTNVKEEMSEPIVLQINTSNELNNTHVGPDREEKEGNKESGNLVVENVVSGNVMEDVKEIPEIKKEAKGEPETITLDDDDETDVVKVEPQNDIRQNGKEVQQTIIQEPFVIRLPSEAFVESTLENLKIPFTRDGIGFLCKIKCRDIPATASPGTTFEISSSDNSFFKCLSLFFTGTIDGIDFSKVNESSPEFRKLHECNELTIAHFTLICSWFRCRIGIFSNGRLSGKYGNWNGDEPIFLIENNNGFYKPVLSFK
uniref:Uncharacterized protein n=1 Tax=Panagrolaimus davidi TaxID=227884 RepID=A0A914Q8H6_9BILA